VFTVPAGPPGPVSPFFPERARRIAPDKTDRPNIRHQPFWVSCPRFYHLPAAPGITCAFEPYSLASCPAALSGSAAPEQDSFEAQHPGKAIAKSEIIAPRHMLWHYIFAISLFRRPGKARERACIEGTALISRTSGKRLTGEPRTCVVGVQNAERNVGEGTRRIVSRYFAIRRDDPSFPFLPRKSPGLSSRALFDIGFKVHLVGPSTRLGRTLTAKRLESLRARTDGRKGPCTKKRASLFHDPRQKQPGKAARPCCACVSLASSVSENAFFRPQAPVDWP